MRVLVSERSFGGHRKNYIEWISKIENIEFFVMAPENFGIDEKHFYKYVLKSNQKNAEDYFCWIKQMQYIVKENDIDVVHILDGDSIMRYFGMGFSGLSVKRIVVTYHHFYQGFIRKISYRMMCCKKNRICVAHTDSVCNALNKIGVYTVQCDYPAFNFESIENKDPVTCKQKYGISLNLPTIGIIGGMSKYKNIIPFLEIMQQCNKPFQILIAGKAGAVNETEICNAISPYRENVKLVLRTLSDEEYEDAIVASDIIFCLYGHEFDGASGPLTDGVCAKKMILACKHGSLGEITSQNLLGITAECRDREEMLRQTKLALSHVCEFKYGELANRYRDRLNPRYFKNTYYKIYMGKKIVKE